MYSVMELAEKEAGVCLKKIALATDFSGASEKAVDCAVGSARSYGAQLYLVHAIHSEPGLLPDLPSHDQLQRDGPRALDCGARSAVSRAAPCDDGKSLTARQIYRASEFFPPLRLALALTAGERRRLGHRYPVIQVTARIDVYGEN